VQIAGYAQGAPMTGGASFGGRVGRPTGGPPIEFRGANVDPEYFTAIGATLVTGRFIGHEDRAGAPLVAVATEEFVRVNLDPGPAVGQKIRIPVGGKVPSAPTTIAEGTIVGVVKDIMQEPTDGKRPPLVLFSRAQQPARVFLSMVIRTTGQPEALEARIREAVKALDPLLPPPKFRTMAQALAERVAPRRFTLVLLVAFAALAGGLAVIGLYSVLAYLVAERTREIGIHIALGANTGRVRRMILGQGLRLTLAGLALGGVVSLAVVRVLQAWMYEMSVYDAPTFVAVTAILCVVALFASWLPARRASRVDPIQVLRAD
jgi:putative ABC transport system permease protein